MTALRVHKTLATAAATEADRVQEWLVKAEVPQQVVGLSPNVAEKNSSELPTHSPACLVRSAEERVPDSAITAAEDLPHADRMRVPSMVPPHEANVIRVANTLHHAMQSVDQTQEMVRDEASSMVLVMKQEIV